MLQPPIAQTETMPPGSNQWQHMWKSLRPGSVFGIPMFMVIVYVVSSQQ